VVKPLARVAEVRAPHQDRQQPARHLCRSPHRRSASLAGHIRRGDNETIEAVIWLSDMRDFTALSDRLPPQQLIDTLNRYFDCRSRRSWRRAARC